MAMRQTLMTQWRVELQKRKSVTRINQQKYGMHNMSTDNNLTTVVLVFTQQLPQSAGDTQIHTHVVNSWVLTISYSIVSQKVQHNQSRGTVRLYRNLLLLEQHLFSYSTYCTIKQLPQEVFLFASRQLPYFYCLTEPLQVMPWEPIWWFHHLTWSNPQCNVFPNTRGRSSHSDQWHSPKQQIATNN